MPLHRMLALACLLPAMLDAAPLRVLFLGNSLTAGNNVPALVQTMARLQGADVTCDAVAPGGYAIEDHWHDGRYALLESRTYHVLVLQQGPSTLPESQANLLEWAVTWSQAARQNGVEPALYMIWPVRTQANGSFLVSQSYRNAAQAAQAEIFPAGEAWRDVLRLDPTIPLYSGDNLHAEPTGSFLAAMVIARGLVALDPSRVPNTVNGISVPTATLNLFRGVVAAIPAVNLAAPTGTGGSTQPTPVDPPGPPPAVIPPPAETTPTPAPSAPAIPAAPASGDSGGGAPSLWFLLALLALSLVRHRTTAR